MGFMKYIFVSFFLFFSTILPGQIIMEGQWSGTITKDLYPGSEIFQFDLIIKRDGGKIEGQSIVRSGNLFAVMEITGAISGDVVFFKEIKITDSKEPETMEWCLKNAHLYLKFKEGIPHLEGMWEGYTSFKTCSPGMISLSRPVVRP